MPAAIRGGHDSKAEVMEIFPENHVISFTDGTECTVKEYLGSIGSRYFYTVRCGYSEYRLVWDTNPALYGILAELCRRGAPGNGFEWPLAVTDMNEAGFGYMMVMMPDGYVSIAEFLVSRVRFMTPELMLSACAGIIGSFRTLHERGLCYHNVDTQSICVNPSNGDVFVRNPEYISQIGARPVFVHAPYITPLELRKNGPADQWSDCFTLAYVLFVVIYGISPFAGRLCYEYVQDSMADKAYVFIMDPDDERNRVPFNFELLKKKWATSPDVLRNAFVRAFSREAIHEPQKRISVAEWENIFTQTKFQCVSCPECGRSTFIDITDGQSECMMCGKHVARFSLLKIGTYEIPLLPGQSLEYGHIHQESRDSRPYATVLAHPQQPDKWGLRNMSEEEWAATLDDGTVKTVPPGKIMPVNLNIKVSFTSDAVGEIVY